MNYKLQIGVFTFSIDRNDFDIFLLDSSIEHNFLQRKLEDAGPVTIDSITWAL